MGHATVYNVWNRTSVRPVWNKKDVLTYDDKFMFSERDTTAAGTFTPYIYPCLPPLPPPTAVTKLPAHISVTVFQSDSTPERRRCIVWYLSQQFDNVQTCPYRMTEKNICLQSQKRHSEDTQGSHKPEWWTLVGTVELPQEERDSQVHVPVPSVSLHSFLLATVSQGQYHAWL